MSDWGAVHTTEKAALSGLDQESGEEMDEQVYFGSALEEAVEKGNVPLERLNDMVRRILRGMFASGIVDDQRKQAVLHVTPRDRREQRNVRSKISG